MASLWREGHIIKTVNSILLNKNIGTITISCNNYTDAQWELVNTKLNNSKIKLYRTNNEKGSCEKLRFISTGSNYYVSLADDDLIYPPDYYEYLIAGVDKYNAYVSLHGRILKKGKITNYYSDFSHIYPVLKTVIEDVEVDIASNCGCLFKRNFFNNLDEWYNLAEHSNMDDIYTNYWAKIKNIKRMVLKHNINYVNHKIKHSGDNYVATIHRYDCQHQTDFINNYFNKL